MSESIVPFADLKAKRAHEAARDDGSANAISAIQNILGALEGLENQMHSLIQLVADQDKRIRALEKAQTSKIIKVAP